ncbi:SulP family inorganic anion transporter [Nocardia sp. alder85J]|uniref:SulP family inorganic anion transporter n=1 Tax=Nocardia sp. alder85J TaxID=2862949 RepID=UPI001CD7E6F2|nr:SulP family inorganic anion transporter [Nocardia sp. alder85J]MCX4098383.1 SulP family inorganic anion transporter [Nocardia sp. alder85J]
MLVGGRFEPRLAFALLTVATATPVTQLAHLRLPLEGALHSGLPAPAPSFLHPDQLGSRAAPAQAGAAPAALESLLSATAAMPIGSHHDPNRELLGQGLTNIAAPRFGRVPATGAIARTAVDVRSGARTRLATLTHVAVLAAIICLAAPLVARIPVAALAGVLLALHAPATEARLHRIPSRRHRTPPRRDTEYFEDSARSADEQALPPQRIVTYRLDGPPVLRRHPPVPARTGRHPRRRPAHATPHHPATSGASPHSQPYRPAAMRTCSTGYPTPSPMPATGSGSPRKYPTDERINGTLCAATNLRICGSGRSRRRPARPCPRRILIPIPAPRAGPTSGRGGSGPP